MLNDRQKEYLKGITRIYLFNKSRIYDADSALDLFNQYEILKLMEYGGRLEEVGVSFEIENVRWRDRDLIKTEEMFISCCCSESFYLYDNTGNCGPDEIFRMYNEIDVKKLFGFFDMLIDLKRVE